MMCLDHLKKIVLLGLMLSQYALANSELDECFVAAGSHYEIAPRLLKAMASVESSMNPKAYVQLAESESRGLMQINSFWYPALAEIGISPDDLWEPCVNIHVGAWILSQEIARYGHSWTAVGSYYAGAYSERTKGYKTKHYLAYTQRVKKRLALIR